MKRSIPTLLLLALCAFPRVSSAQLWIEERTDTKLTFAFRGVNSLGVLTTENQGAGARLSFDFNAATKSLRVNVTNLSGGWRTVGTGTEAANVYFGAGTLMGFGFETAPDNLTATAFSAWANSAFNINPAWGADAGFRFKLDQQYNLSGGGASLPFYMDVGADATDTHGRVNEESGSPSLGLSAGYGASYRFTFNEPNFNAALFNPLDFFFNDIDSDIYDMSFRFQQTNGIGTGVTSYARGGAGFTSCLPPPPPCNADGSDKVALVFHLEEDSQVPEPSTYGLFGAAALLVFAARRRFRR